jgi:hypothetical protein
MGGKRTHRVLISLVVVLLLLSQAPPKGLADVPLKINYQGYLTDDAGTPIDGVVSILFTIYDSGGTPLWSETRPVTVTDGVFSVDLGDDPLNPVDLPFNEQYYLGVNVDGDGEMTPRRPLTSVGYAMRAKEADSVADGSVTTVVIANNAVTTDKIENDAITGAKIGPKEVTSVNIANEAVGSDQINDGSISDVDLEDNTITADKISTDVVSSIDGVINDGGDIDLVEGTNITITPDDGADTITIAATGVGNANQIQGNDVAPTAPAAGQVLKWSGTLWQPANDEGTSYSAGDGLSLVGTTFNVGPGTTVAIIPKVKWILRFPQRRTKSQAPQPEILPAWMQPEISSIVANLLRTLPLPLTAIRPLKLLILTPRFPIMQKLLQTQPTGAGLTTLIRSQLPRWATLQHSGMQTRSKTTLWPRQLRQPGRC